MRSKKIYVNTKKTRYVIVKLFDNRKEMRDYYFKYDLSTGLRDTGHHLISGAHLSFVKYRVDKDGRSETSGQSGIILLSRDNCGAGVVSHEFNHAVLWAWRHGKTKKQYPIVIRNMREEEEILHNHTQAVKDFYNWFFKIAEK